MAASARLEQGLQAASVPGPEFPYVPQEAQFYGTAAHSGELNQQAAGVLGLIFCTGLWNLSSVVLLLA
jgi:hypothetical protein